MLTTLIGAVFVLLFIAVMLWCVRTILRLMLPSIPDMVDVFVVLLGLIAVAWMLTRYGIVSLP
jgi:hypothetical protein